MPVPYEVIFRSGFDYCINYFFNIKNALSTIFVHNYFIIYPHTHIPTITVFKNIHVIKI